MSVHCCIVLRVPLPVGQLLAVPRVFVFLVFELPLPRYLFYDLTQYKTKQIWTSNADDTRRVLQE